MQMSVELNSSDTVHGFGAGLFFIAYALFGVPSNMALAVLARVAGSPRWVFWVPRTQASIVNPL
jgi:Flp pilus assembly protein TadB